MVLAAQEVNKDIRTKLIQKLEARDCELWMSPHGSPFQNIDVPRPTQKCLHISRVELRFIGLTL